MPFITTVWDHTYVMGMNGHAGCPEVLSPTPFPRQRGSAAEDQGRLLTETCSAAEIDGKWSLVILHLESHLNVQHLVLVVEMRTVSLFLSLSSLGPGMAFPSGSLSQYNHPMPSRGLLLTERGIFLYYRSHWQPMLSRNGVSQRGKLH